MYSVRKLLIAITAGRNLAIFSLEFCFTGRKLRLIILAVYTCEVPEPNLLLRSSLNIEPPDKNIFQNKIKGQFSIQRKDEKW